MRSEMAPHDTQPQARGVPTRCGRPVGPIWQPHCCYARHEDTRLTPRMVSRIRLSIGVRLAIAASFRGALARNSNSAVIWCNRGGAGPERRWSRPYSWLLGIPSGLDPNRGPSAPEGRLTDGLLAPDLAARRRACAGGLHGARRRYGIRQGPRLRDR